MPKNYRKIKAVNSSKNSIGNFLRALFQGAMQGQIVVLTDRDWSAHFFHVNDIAGASKKIAEITMDYNVFVGRCLQNSVALEGSRGSSATVGYCGGVFLDADTLEGPHGGAKLAKVKSLPHSTEEVLGILSSSGLPEPTLVINTGGGCHIHYLFQHADLIETSDQREIEANFSRAFQQAVRSEFAERGYELDNT